MTGLKGYYMLKNQAQGHPADPLPVPDLGEGIGPDGLEQRGYRKKPGTSIVIRLNPGKLGTLSLRETVEKYLCGARMPVYYNGRRVGKTYQEVMQAAHEMAGERIYELPSELKEKFDEHFPCIKGQYPRLAVRVIPLDTKEDQPMPGLSGVLVKYEVRYERVPEWDVKDQHYRIRTEIDCSEADVKIELRSQNRNIEIFAYKKKKEMSEGIFWPELLEEYDPAKTASLAEAFEKIPACPRTAEELGEVWRPFAEDMDIYAAWKAYHDYRQEKEFSFSSVDCGCPGLDMGHENVNGTNVVYAYQGVLADCYKSSHNYFSMGIGNRVIFFLENECRPTVEVSRSEITGLPLKTLIALGGISYKNEIMEEVSDQIGEIWRNASLQEWRQAREYSLEQWMNRYLEKYFENKKQGDQESWCRGTNQSINFAVTYLYNTYKVLDKYLKAHLQDKFFMTICYEEGQKITFLDKTGEDREEVYDLFPPMMFCKAASDQSRKFICHADSYIRRGITSDHPFVVWLLENSVRLNKYFQRQFRQMIKCLCEDEADDILQICDMIREQLLALTDRHGVDISSMPQLREDDFFREV